MKVSKEQLDRMAQYSDLNYLRECLLNKTVISIENSLKSEAYYYITTSDGKSFHICATELGAWIEIGPNE